MRKVLSLVKQMENTYLSRESKYEIIQKINVKDETDAVKEAICGKKLPSIDIKSYISSNKTTFLKSNKLTGMKARVSETKSIAYKITWKCNNRQY